MSYFTFRQKRLGKYLGGEAHPCPPSIHWEQAERIQTEQTACEEGIKHSFQNADVWLGPVPVSFNHQETHKSSAQGILEEPAIDAPGLCRYHPPTLGTPTQRNSPGQDTVRSANLSVAGVQVLVPLGSVLQGSSYGSGMFPLPCS